MKTRILFILTLFLMGCSSGYEILKKQNPVLAEKIIDKEIFLLNKKYNPEYGISLVAGKIMLHKDGTLEFENGNKYYYEWDYRENKIILWYKAAGFTYGDTLEIFSTNSLFYTVKYKNSSSPDGYEYPSVIGKESLESLITSLKEKERQKKIQLEKEKEEKRIAEEKELAIRKEKNKEMYKEVLKKFKITGGKFGDGWSNLKWGMPNDQVLEILLNEGFKKPNLDSKDPLDTMRKSMAAYADVIDKLSGNKKNEIKQFEIVLEKENLTVSALFFEIIPEYYGLYEVKLNFKESRWNVWDTRKYLNLEFLEKLEEKYGKGDLIDKKQESYYEQAQGGYHVFEIETYNWDDSITGIQIEVSEMKKGNYHYATQYNSAIIYYSDKLFNLYYEKKKEAETPKNSENL